MFDGVPDQLHQFIASSRSTTTSSLPLPLSSFPLHASPSPNTITFPPLDAYSNNHHHNHHQVPLQPHHQVLLQPLHHNPPPPAQKINHEEKEGNNLVNSFNLEIDDDTDRSSIPEPVAPPPPPPWSHDEVLALLRIRSTMENWFPDFTWEHISRKMAELGFKRSAEKCKEKFEEESRYFNNINYIKNYRFLTELEELYHGHDHPHHHQNPQVVGAEKSQKAQAVDKPSERREGEEDKRGQSVEKESENNEEKMMMEERLKRKKRKRHKSFEIFKGFCEDIVNKMMAQQEEMQNKLLEDMVKRDEEKVAKEEAWKKQEILRMNKELEIMAHEQALAGDRQATIIEFLKKFTSTSSSSSGGEILKSFNPFIPPTSSSSIQPLQNPNPTSTSTVGNRHQNSNSLSLVVPENPSSNPATPTIPKLPTTSSPLASKNPNSFDTQKKPLTPTSTSCSIQKVPQNPSSNEKDDIGKRWPRDEVLALINLRCSLYNSNEDKEGVKAPLWERISQGMLDLGYKRSAKRCKEKWENINKYFRKTKDVNKKRSIDSRTCPYFHQLSTLYNQGTVNAGHPTQVQEHCSANSPESHSSALPETTGRGGNSSLVGIVGSSFTADSCLHDTNQGARNMVQVSAAFDFEF
ncbi:trihelix transcription factor GTL2 [Ziziphus jujuba]|uniref:Trihelix transcription factor GTL2 n=1 Tax=Ziziphus jujuba TaxID=326968 RepID=A0A6P3ZJT0_ZIZJJ|nr:trihelix transcription factor GTL2 [Ziziphus jujuba]